MPRVWAISWLDRWIGSGSSGETKVYSFDEYERAVIESERGRRPKSICLSSESLQFNCSRNSLLPIVAVCRELVEIQLVQLRHWQFCQIIAVFTARLAFL